MSVTEDKIRVRRVYRTSGLEVWSVRGEVVRDDLDVDFVGGGHYYRNSYIPKGEIWVERNLSRRDFALTAAHAIAEAYMIRKGMDNDQASDIANKVERNLRGMVWRDYTHGVPDMETICLDFDGVVHSYTSGFQGTTVIPDPPVPGAPEAITRLRQEYDVVIHSTRCATPEGRAAIEAWLEKYGIDVDGVEEHKPAAMVYVDDKGLRFEGDWDSMLEHIQETRVRKGL